MQDYGEVPYGLEMVNLGSTFSKYGFDYRYYGKKGYNFASAPQTLKTDREVLETYQDHIAGGAVVVVVVVCPFGFCVHDYRTLKLPLACRCVRLVQRGKRVIKKLIHYDRVRQMAAKKGGPPSARQQAQTNARGRVKGWKQEFGLRDTTSQRPTRELRKTFGKVREELSAMVRLCRERGFRPLIINMPAAREEYSQFSDGFIQAFYEDNIREADTQGVPVLDYFRDGRFDDISLYENYADCFNDKGRRLFAAVLIEDMKKLGLWEEE